MRAARVATLLAILLALPDSVGAGTRIPVSSSDDATSPTANRIAAVTIIVYATNARLARVIVAYPPNPCAFVTEPTQLCSAAGAAVSAYDVLGQSVADACAGIPSDGSGAGFITDADAFASDTSLSGIANQLASIATVLGNADDRLASIRYPNPGPPGDPEAAALLALLAELATGDRIASAWLAVPPNPIFPPSPICPS
jgi:hypothetical protein